MGGGGQKSGTSLPVTAPGSRAQNICAARPLKKSPAIKEIKGRGGRSEVCVPGAHDREGEIQGFFFSQTNFQEGRLLASSIFPCRFNQQRLRGSRKTGIILLSRNVGCLRARGAVTKCSEDCAHDRAAATRAFPRNSEIFFWPGERCSGTPSEKSPRNSGWGG